MRRSSGEAERGQGNETISRMDAQRGRGQVEPLAAIFAVVIVGLALSLYAGVLDARLPGDGQRDVAAGALERVERAVAPAGVTIPTRLSRAPAAGPSGYATNVTLAAGGNRWTVGPPAPRTTSPEATAVSVRLAPATVRPGTLEVRVW